MTNSTPAPILAEVRDGANIVFARGGLHRRMRGDIQEAWFSLFWEAHDAEDGKVVGRGVLANSEKLDLFPEFEDVAALHFADQDGVPLYAFENGVYYLGLRLTGDCKYQRNKVMDHFRIGPEEADRLYADMAAAVALHGDPVASFDAGVAVIQAFIEAQLPQWKAEAESAILAHDLQVYGDVEG